jgi:hypothetical protein
MNCRHFRGKLTAEDREFLVKLVKSYDARLMLNSWLEEGRVERPGGHGSVDPEKVKAVEILRRRSFCKKEHVRVYAVEQGCVFWQPKKM